MTQLDFSTILDACKQGGPSALSAVTQLRPAAGAHASVAPAKFVSGDKPVFAYETRFIDGDPRTCVLIDSKASQLNRIEDALQIAIEDGHPLLGRIPRIRVTYQVDSGPRQLWDLTLPHRFSDGHVRAGTIDGEPVTATDTYRAARDATPSNALALFNLSPISLVFGSWDSTRKTGQGRWPSALVGEIIGVLADQNSSAEAAAAKTGGARIDPVGMKIEFDQSTLVDLADAQRDELSASLYTKISKKAKGLKAGGKTSASELGLGGLPPSLKELGGVACSQIILSQVLSFATLRRLRFGAGQSGDAACRALLASIAVNGMVRSSAELFLRANCLLVEAAEAIVELDIRNGHQDRVELPTIDQADSILAQALDHASDLAGVDWKGQILDVQGNPAIVAVAQDDDPAGD